MITNFKNNQISFLFTLMKVAVVLQKYSKYTKVHLEVRALKTVFLLIKK